MSEPHTDAERSCEEAFEEYWPPLEREHDAPGTYVLLKNLGREAFAAGFRAGARTPTLPAGAAERIAELERQLDEAQLRSIEARNPGIDMDEVRRWRAGDRPPAEREGMSVESQQRNHDIDAADLDD